jgi:hypothetical protein
MAGDAANPEPPTGVTHENSAFVEFRGVFSSSWDGTEKFSQKRLF